MSENTHVPGELPPIHDEAGDTPLWVPLVGMCCLFLLALGLIWQASDADLVEAVEEAVVEVEAEVERDVERLVGAD